MFKRVLALIALCLTSPAQAEEVILTGPPICDTAPLIVLAQEQPLAAQGIHLHLPPLDQPGGDAQDPHLRHACGCDGAVADGAADAGARDGG